jgi:hypothetical protein
MAATTRSESRVQTRQAPRPVQAQSEVRDPTLIVSPIADVENADAFQGTFDVRQRSTFGPWDDDEDALERQIPGSATGLVEPHGPRHEVESSWDGLLHLGHEPDDPHPFSCSASALAEGPSVAPEFSSSLNWSGAALLGRIPRDGRSAFA